MFSVDDRVKLIGTFWMSEGLGNISATVVYINSYEDELWDDESDAIIGSQIITEYTIQFDNPVTDNSGYEYQELVVLGHEIELVEKKPKEPTGFGKFLREHNL